MCVEWGGGLFFLSIQVEILFSFVPRCLVSKFCSHAPGILHVPQLNLAPHMEICDKSLPQT